MDLPVPTHLQQHLKPVGEKNSEYEVTGTIQCACGNEIFEVWESNERLIIKLICKQCGREIGLLDAGRHGWNGFVCKDDFLDRTLPLRKYRCPRCKKDAFSITVFLSSQGKQDFLDECVAHDDSFSADDWVDGFEWITVSLFCNKCTFQEKDWVDLETM